MSESTKSAINTKLPNEYFRNYEIRNSEQIVKRLITEEVPYQYFQRNLETELDYKFQLGRLPSTKKLRQQQRQLRKRKFLTRKQRKEFNLLKLDKTKKYSYKSLESIRELWRQYMRDNLKLLQPIPNNVSDTNWLNFNQILARSEFIGCEIRVIRSKIPNQIGIEGTLILETKMTFQIVTKDDKLKVIPKDSSVFQFSLDNYKFTIFGKHLVMKPSERTVKKIKTQINPDL